MIDRVWDRTAARRAPRLGLAGALTGGLLVLVGAFGGIGYAAKGVAESNTQSKNASNSSAHHEYDRKITICHRTASGTNPYVEITISESAIKAHEQHPPKDGRHDIIPAPPTGCPTK